MTDAATLLALADKVEKLTAPDLRTDLDIAKALDLLGPYKDWPEGSLIGEVAVRYTGSVDAAMTLRLAWMSIELTESAANDSTSDPRFTRCRIWDWRRGPLAIDRTNEWKVEGNRPLPINTCSAILHALAAQTSSVAAGKR